MNQTQFDAATKGTGAIYVPSVEEGDHYELVAISVIVGNANDRIQVSVKDELGTYVHHAFGHDFERFPYMGSPVQFNLGAGSHYSVPNDPPDHITIEGLPSDEVRVGNANTIGYQHTDWAMTFQRVGAVPPPVTPPPDNSHYVTEMELPRLVRQIMLDQWGKP